MGKSKVNTRQLAWKDMDLIKDEELYGKWEMQIPYRPAETCLDCCGLCKPPAPRPDEARLIVTDLRIKYESHRYRGRAPLAMFGLGNKNATESMEPINPDHAKQWTEEYESITHFVKDLTGFSVYRSVDHAEKDTCCICCGGGHYESSAFKIGFQRAGAESNHWISAEKAPEIGNVIDQIMGARSVDKTFQVNKAPGAVVFGGAPAKRLDDVQHSGAKVY